MTPAVEQLVRETMELTGAETPQLLEDDAPVLSEEALSLAEGDGRGGGPEAGTGFYLVGIIGGKDVGKSALVNALVGRAITAITSHGPGTESVVAYAHATREPALRALLEREVQGQFRVVTHDSPHLLRQVLLDLPDIDSHWTNHLQVTRAMLRHMLYPVWVQSIEKYADRQPQEMLSRVAAGNAAQNFVFCLNKVDQVDERRTEGRADVSQVPPAAAEIREDFAQRIARTLGLVSPPEVFLVSALNPERYDLPRLRRMLAQQKTDAVVRQSKELAVRRQDRTLLAWLNEQRLGERAARLARLYQEAEELVAARIGVPLLEEAIPQILEDPANRLAMADEVLRRRVARWPLVNLVHTLLSPLLAVWRSNVGAGGRVGAGGAAALVESYVEQATRHRTGLAAAGGIGPEQGGLASLVQTTFAQLRQSQPVVATLYGDQKLWENMSADAATNSLVRALASAVERQRAAALEQLAGRHGVVAPLFRWLLTVGALLWFPFIQPVLAGFLAIPDLTFGPSDWRRLGGLVVSVVSGEALLKNVTFLIIWFTVIWLSLRWGTQRRLARLLSRWRSADYPDPSLNLTTQTVQWTDNLLAPLRQAAERMTDVANRAKALEKLSGAAA